MDLIAQIASDDVLDAAFAWLCERRQHHHYNYVRRWWRWVRSGVGLLLGVACCRLGWVAMLLNMQPSCSDERSFFVGVGAFTKLRTLQDWRTPNLAGYRTNRSLIMPYKYLPGSFVWAMERLRP